jgi:transcriptional regulator with XRE-family HTH domain
MTTFSTNRPFIPPPNPTFAALLRAWRELRGYSMWALAERADLTHGLISRFEAGKRQPSRATVVALADALGLTGAHRAMLFGSVCMTEHPLTESQAAAIAGWRDTFTRRYSAD